MSFFSLRRSTDRYGIIIDIGSGSVLVAIVHSKKSEPYAHIIWSQREHTPLRNVDSLEQSAKAVITALVNASMQLDAEGRKALYEYDTEAKPSHLQCNISAPWSYTVTKTINYQQEDPFTITDDLIEDLTRTIQDKIETDLNESKTLKNLGLEIIARATLGIIANGYRVQHPAGEKTKQLTISHTSVVAHQYLIEAINEMQEKLFAQTELKKLSFMLMLYCVTRELFPQHTDVCLIDITYEATEIGIVRDGILTYSTHTPFGSFSLAREISAITGSPLHETFGYLHNENPYEFLEHLTKAQRDEAEQVLDAYVEQVSNLFQETGDSLSIPKHISLHANIRNEALFMDLIEKSAKRRIHTEPIMFSATKEIIRQCGKQKNKGDGSSSSNDTALLLSSQFFHKQHKRKTFEYL